MPKDRQGHAHASCAGTGSPVLVLHAWWGLNATIKGLCMRLAETGFSAFAPDLYHGKVTDRIEEAETLAASLDGSLARVRTELADAAAFLRERGAARADGIAVIGFSMGAFYALDLSVSASDLIDSVVVFYGTGPGAFGRSRAAYLGHFAENDPYEPPSNVAELENALRDAGRPVTFHHYAGMGHWFFEPDRPEAYHAAAAALAWERTLAFLRHANTL